MFFFDPTMIVVVPAMLLAMWAQSRVKRAYQNYAQVGTVRGITGAQLARRMLADNGIEDVEVEATPGEMTDHYDPTAKVVRLSEGVYDGNSVAALGIAAHEVGHACQHATHYAPLHLRGLMYPVSAIGSNLGWILLMVGFGLAAFASGPLGIFVAKLGIYLFAAAVAFTLVTLPVEFNASKRAMYALVQGGYLTQDESAGAKAVLNAAALTYVAAAAVAISELLHMLLLFGNMRDE